MRQKWIVKYAAPAFIAAVLASGVALAQSGFDLSWATVDGGGYIASTSSGGSFSLGSSIGQPDAGPMTGGNGAFTLTGGFWSAGALTASPSSYQVYLPITTKN